MIGRTGGQKGEVGVRDGRGTRWGAAAERGRRGRVRGCSWRLSGKTCVKPQQIERLGMEVAMEGGWETGESHVT